MFYFLVSSYLTYNLILIAAAVIPAVLLMVKVYRSDRLEREPKALLWRLVRVGVFSALLALVSERVLGLLLYLVLPKNAALYNVLLYFIVVALSEEGAKYLLLKKSSWSSPEFNCQYDGVVYAVFVSLGFALWENISYVLHYGFGTAIVRAVTAIPGHACFGVFMGIFYGLAKRAERQGKLEAAKLSRGLSVAVPMVLHGAYDYIASTKGSSWYFVGFIALLFLLSYYLVGKSAKQDRYL